LHSVGDRRGKIMNVPMEHDTLEIVSGESLERELNRVRAVVADSLSGIFGSLYCANAVPALRWVHATLTETALVAHALVLPALTQEQRELYYAESRLLAALFGIPLNVGTGLQLTRLRLRPASRVKYSI
jgi:hypothetical protein